MDGRWVYPLFTNGQTRGELEGKIPCQRLHLATDLQGKLSQPTWSNWDSYCWDLVSTGDPWRNICINSQLSTETNGEWAMRTWVCSWPEARGQKHRHTSECWTNSPVSLKKRWCEYHIFAWPWFPWPRVTVLKQYQWIPLITVNSTLEGKEMSYSVLWSQWEGEHTEQLGRNLMIPRQKERKEREALSDSQCVSYPKVQFDTRDKKVKKARAVRK